MPLIHEDDPPAVVAIVTSVAIIVAVAILAYFGQ